MRLIGSTIVSTDALSQLFGGKQAIGLDDIALAVDPFGLNGVKPGALCWQQEGQDTHACARLLDLQVVLANPGANSLTLVPGSIIPDQKPVGLATLEQTLAAPVQKWRGDRAHRSSRDKTEPHLLTPGFVRSPFLPQHTITGQRFGVRVAFFPGLFDQANGMLRVLPELLLTVAQGAMQLGVNRETVYRLIKRGDLPAARVGSVLRISPADLAAYLRHS